MRNEAQSAKVPNFPDAKVPNFPDARVLKKRSIRFHKRKKSKTLSVENEERSTECERKEVKK